MSYVTSATLSVKRFQLVESFTMTPEQFAFAARRQWFVGMHKISVHVVTAESAHPLGSTPPQALMKGIVLQLHGLLVVRVTPQTTFPLLVKVMGHPNNGPGQLLGIASIDPTDFFREVAVTRTTDHPMSSLQLTMPVFPSSGLATETVLAIIALEITADVPLELRVPMPVPPPLEFRSGPIRISALDLYFPAFAAAEGVAVSNVICVLNVSATAHWVNVQATPSHFTTAPPDGLVLQPGQRGYLALTLASRSQLAVASPVTAALPSSFASNTPGLVAELYCVELEKREAYAPTRFRLHDDVPRAAADVVRPYHYWFNGSCLTNRPVPADDAVYIRSVIPPFSATPANASGSDGPELVSAVETPTDARVSSLSASLGSGLEMIANKAPGTLVRDKDSGAVARASAGGCVLPSSPSRLIVEMANRACRCTLRFGEIRGSAIPAPSVCLPFQSGYRLVLTSMHESWVVEVAETPIMLPDPLTGTISLSEVPLVARKAPVAESQQALRVTLFEVTNAAPAGASVTTVSAPCRQSEEIPVAVSVLTLWPLHRSAMQRPLPVSLLFLESFSRYDDMPSTGVVIQHSVVTFVPLETLG